MEDLNKRIEKLHQELDELVALKARYEADPMQYLKDEISFMRAQKHITVEQIINTVINHVKTYGVNQSA